MLFRSVLSAAFALMNYAFDEIGNPALRPVRRKDLRKSRKADRLAAAGAANPRKGVDDVEPDVYADAS